MLQISALAIGDIIFRPMYRRVRIDGAEIKLTEVESYVLEALVLPEGRMASREALCAAMYSHTGFVPISIRHVDRHICNLRRKLHESKRVQIQSVRKLGYKLSVS